MTVEELIQELQKLPKELNVELDDGNFDYEIKCVQKTISAQDDNEVVCNISIKQNLTQNYLQI